MIQSYIVIALRSIVRHRLYAFISVGGLALGFACAAMIGLWVGQEMSYDAFHSDAHRLYRMVWDVKASDGTEGLGPGTPPPLAATLVENLPEVEASTRMRPMRGATIRTEGVSFDEDGIVSADSNFFDLFSFPLREGDAQTALALPNSVVLTRSMSQKLFGSHSPVGRTISINEPMRNMYGTYDNLFRVTGLIDDPPSTSHIQFTMLTSMTSYPEVAWRNWSWVWMQVATYIRLHEGATASAVESRIPELVRRFGEAGFRRLGITYEELTGGGLRFTFGLQPMRDVYLGSTSIGNRVGPVGDRSQVSLLSTVAILVLIIACANFVNLTIARSSERAKEIGVRKVLGSRRKMFVAQFVVESMLISLMSLLLGLLIVSLFSGPFNSLTGSSIDPAGLNVQWIVGLVVLAVLVGCVSGLYPGLVLSALPSALAMRSTGPTMLRGKRFRNMLVAAQFAITIGLTVCTITFQYQFEFMRSKDLGFEEEGIVVVSNKNDRLGPAVTSFRDELLSLPHVVDATVSTGIPPSPGFQDGYVVDGGIGRSIGLISYLADERFIRTMNITIVEGRGFSSGFSDSSSVVLNETAVRMFGLTEPVGKTIIYPGGNNTRFTVVGVMKDFHFESLYAPIGPFALFHPRSQSYSTADSYVLVRCGPGQMQQTLASIEDLWRSVAPNAPFSYSFLDERLGAAYRSAERVGVIVFFFAALSITIACVGLFGLAAFATTRRTKEVGVRKVLGASDAGIVSLLLREFWFIVLAANVLAWPVAWFVTDEWLADFAYRTPFAWWVYVVSGLIALSLAIATVSGLAFQAARANPVESLRYE